MQIAVVTGNPKPASRTHGVALALADLLAIELSPERPAPLVIDLAEHRPGPRPLRHRARAGQRRRLGMSSRHNTITIHAVFTRN